MGRGEEAVRREAVARRLSGESPESIARSLGRTLQWVARWVRRHDPDDPGRAKERSRAPRGVANRTPPSLEAQVVAVRARLEEDRFFCRIRGSFSPLDRVATGRSRHDPASKAR